ncbi:acyl-CoA dehydrogenase family protein [Streptomyces sp. NPDC096324]|uniref:acyl-CoA dehydrogenase family protein n=1 Tax=Streptomyces sp. NPDC096324 TaxID=3366085 RepID=UPI0038193BD6
MTSTQPSAPEAGVAVAAPAAAGEGTASGACSPRAPLGLPASYAAALRLDERLGDPGDSGRLFSYARSGALDDAETFPLEICRELDVLGLPRAYVPAAHGGTLEGYDEAIQLMRAVARRDMTVAVAHGKTFLGAVCLWVGGDREQAARLGERIATGAVVSWGLTERDHGSDLLASEVTADRTPGGYRLTGEKWLINNATRGHLVCVLARTSQDGGPRGLSLLLVDKQALPPGTFRPLPAVKLHGIRGADISGIAFTGTEVPHSALIGREGDGVETVVKSLQLTRTLCSSLSLGAADQALGMSLTYAHERTNYGRLLIDLPQTRRLISESYADLLLAEAVSLVAGRGIHTLTGELAVASAAVKFFVPTLVEGLVSKLTRVMGSRSLLVGDAYRHGRFQKVQRDHRIVGIFDGNTVVNLHSLINQFPQLVRGYRRGRVDSAGLHAAVALREPLPGFDPGRLQLLTRSGCSPVQALPAACEALSELADRREVPASLGLLAARTRAVADELHERLAEHRPTAIEVPAGAFVLAERYALCFAASAAIHLWLHNRADIDDPVTARLWESGLWLEACLTNLLRRLGPGLPGPHDGDGVVPTGDRPADGRSAADRPVGDGPVGDGPARDGSAGDGSADVFERLAVPLLAQHAEGRLPSLLPYPHPEDRR